MRLMREAARVHEGSVVPGGRVVQGDAVSRERGACRVWDV